MKKNIVLLSGRDTYGIMREREKWIRAFKERHSEMNIEHISLSDIRQGGKTIEQNILSVGLFAEKRLFVISGGNEKRDKTTDFVAFFERIFSVLPDDHFLLFSDLTERGLDLVPLISQIGEVKKYDALYDTSTWEGRFGELDKKTIETVLRVLASEESASEEYEINPYQSHLIANILELLTLESLTGTISRESIDGAIGELSAGKIFGLVDSIMACDRHRSLEIFRRIISGRRTDEFLPSFIGAIRNSVYAKYLQDKKVTNPSIKINPFVLKKSQSAPISYAVLRDFYQRIIRTSIAYKSGKGMKDTELGRILEIELAIMGLKK